MSSSTDRICQLSAERRNSLGSEPVLFGGNLITLEKKTGGVRPIAVGYTLRRITAKCANAYAASQLSDYFSPIQLGVGIPGGCEAAVHATRRYIEAMPDGYVIAKIDFRTLSTVFAEI